MELVFDARARVAEGPVWDAGTHTWLFVDITPGTVFRFNPVTRQAQQFNAGQEVSAVLPMDDGRLLLVGRQRLVTCNADGSGISDFGPVLEPNPIVRMNDAKVDSRGRAWVGSRDTERGDRGRLFRIDSSGSPTVVLEGIIVSNGMGWSPDDTSFYFVDSLTYSIQTFTFDAETGSISGGRTLVEFDPESGLPDGLCVDAEGFLWLAHFGAGTITRHEPTGAVVQTLTVPVPIVTSMAFGGSDLRDLLITTGRYKMTDDEVLAHPGSGALFQHRPGVTGQETHLFAAR